MSKPERKKILEKLKENLKTQLVITEFNIRHLNRLKIVKNDTELVFLERELIGQKKQQETLEIQLTTIDDEIKEVSDKI